MKNSKKYLKFLALMLIAGVTLISFTSCSSDDDGIEPEPPMSTTITDIVANNPDFSMLKKAVVRTGLDEVLAGDGEFTVFAPNNDAFAAAGLTNDDLENLPVEALKNILLYHTLTTAVKAADVPAGPNAEVEAANGNMLYVTNNSNGVFVNGIKVIQADIEASNGVIHVIGNVLMPPVGNIVETAQANDALSFLVAAVLRASEGETDVVAVLSGADPLTVFAPTNDAFQAAGFETIADIQDADPDGLAAILTYHVAAGRVFSSDLMNGQEVSMLNGETTTINLDGMPTVKGIGNTEASNIIITDIVATNGVVHVIDRVLLP